jgi:uncharacterized membrane protein YfcA
MSLLIVLLMLVVGLVVGVVSGLVGIGGGILIVPFLYFFYAHPQLSGMVVAEALQTTAAHATSLFVIVPTAVIGARSYNKAGLVIWRAAVPVAMVSIIGAIGGTNLALLLPSEVVRIAFGFFLLVNGILLFVRPHPPEHRPHRLNVPVVIITGLTVGAFSGLMGIGGGAVAGLMLIYLMRLNLKQAAATSLAIAAIAAMTAAITYAFRGLGVTGMPKGSIGYVHVFAALPILLGAIISVRWGARVNQRMHVDHLKLVFVVFFTVLGVYLISQNLGGLR